MKGDLSRWDIKRGAQVEFRRPDGLKTGGFITWLDQPGHVLLVEVEGPVKTLEVALHDVISIVDIMSAPYPQLIMDLPNQVSLIYQIESHYADVYPGNGRVTTWVKGKFAVHNFGILLVPEWQQVRASAGAENRLGFLPYPDRTEYLWVQPTDGLLKVGRLLWEEER